MTNQGKAADKSLFPRARRASAAIWLTFALLNASATTFSKGGPGGAAAKSYPGASSITAEQLQQYVGFIASDEMQGRDTPSRGLDIVARFIALNLRLAGLKPSGDGGTYFQHVALRRDTIDAPATRAEIGGREYSFGTDFLALPVGGSVAAPLVYVGHGWLIKSKGIDPYQGVDVKDKIVVVAGSGLPKGLHWYELGEGWADPYTYAQQHGARALIVMPNFRALVQWDSDKQAALTKGSLSVERFQAAIPPTVPYDFSLSGGTANVPVKDGLKIPSITASPRMAEDLFRGEKRGAGAIYAAGFDEPGESFEFGPNKKVSLTVRIRSQELSAQNVVATLEGSDARLKDECVVVGAHYDHLGVKTGTGVETVYRGADDNGSGTAALLSLAEAFARGPRPKRSLMFVWYCGEEKGEWGSKYITTFSPVPLNNIVAQLNMDMIGRSKAAGDASEDDKDLSGPNEIYVAGSKMLSSDFGEMIEEVNRSYLNLTFNHFYDEAANLNLFRSTDSVEYVRKGVPSILFFSGYHADYHAPTDSPDKLDYAKMEKVARTVYATAWTLADGASRPRIDKQAPKEITGEQ